MPYAAKAFRTVPRLSYAAPHVTVGASEELKMQGANIAIAMLVILGAVLTILGLFGGGNVPIMAMGLIAIAVAGLLGVMLARRSS